MDGWIDRWMAGDVLYNVQSEITYIMIWYMIKQASYFLSQALVSLVAG